MIRELWKEIDNHYLDLIIKPDPRFEKIQQNCAKAGLPTISVSNIHGQWLKLLARLMGAKHILEIGTLGGFSTAWLASTLPIGGKLISLERDPDRSALARKNLDLFEFQAKVEIWVGDALHNMAEMANIDQPAFDLIFIDGEKSQYPDYLERSIPLSRPGTLIMADNVIKHGSVFNEDLLTPDQKGIGKFHEMVAADPRLEASVLQTVGEKGHDGYSFILVGDSP